MKFCVSVQLSVWLAVLVSKPHYGDVIMTGLSIACSTICTVDLRKHHNSASLAFVGANQQWPVDSVMRKVKDGFSSQGISNVEIVSTSWHYHENVYVCISTNCSISHRVTSGHLVKSLWQIHVLKADGQHIIGNFRLRSHSKGNEFQEKRKQQMRLIVVQIQHQMLYHPWSYGDAVMYKFYNQLLFI